MKTRNGIILICTGVAHFLLGVSPFAFGAQFSEFSKKYFFKISEGLSEFPLLNGEMNYENFASFWFVYFGLLLIPLGILVNYIENNNFELPKSFVISYLIVVLIGAFMIPFSGMTFLMLPHALFMLIQKNGDRERLTAKP